MQNIHNKWNAAKEYILRVNPLKCTAFTPIGVVRNANFTHYFSLF